MREARFFHPCDPYLMCLDGYLTALDHKEAIKELSYLEIKQRPVLPFLKRSNPVNKYIGLLRAKLSGKS